MKIKELTPSGPTRNFESVNSGSVFRFNERLYLCTDECSGVRLIDGYLVMFSTEDEVEIVNGTFVVE